MAKIHTLDIAGKLDDELLSRFIDGECSVEERLELYESSGRGRELLRAAHERRDIRHCTFSLGRIGGLVNDVRPRASDFKPQMSREDHDTLDRPDSNTRISPDEFWPVDVVSPRSVGRVGVRSTYLYPTS